LNKGTHTLRGIHYQSGLPIRVTIGQGSIVAVEETGGGKTDEWPVIAPGLFDIQVNGFMGVDFNDDGLTAGQVESACLALLERGVTGFFPTIITGPVERTTRLLGVFAQALRAPGLAEQMIRGIHLEGPFICREDGPRGAHPRAYCLDPDPELLKRWQGASGGLVRIVTLAPELPGSESLIRTCRAAGMVVGIGHTSAGSEKIRMAADAGATLSTHLGNGAHNMLPRHPNYIWDQLAEERLFASMIADGFHLPDAVLKVFIRMKQEQAILISDSMMYSGMAPGRYTSPATGDVRLTPEGKLHMEGEPGTLAGSASMLLDGVRKISGLEGFSFAWNMASIHPSTLLNEPAKGGIAPGAPADLVLLKKRGTEIAITSVVKAGKHYPA
jgi:N-acetylglucosamine-6-phosphate deacetylase